MDDKKIAFIFGSDKEESGIYEGEIEEIGDIKDGYFHSTCLLEFAKEKYPEIGVFKRLTNKHNPEAISFFYAKLFNHIIFLNTTKYNEDGSIGKHGKTGLFLIPDTITEKQKEGLSVFLDKISEYKITIIYDISIENGLFDGKEVISISREEPKEVFNKFFGDRKSKSL